MPNVLTCIEEGCESLARARQLCNPCYQYRARRGIAMPDFQRSIHRVTSVDTGDQTGTCGSCGPVRVYWRSGTPRCGSKRSAEKREAKASARSKLSRPMTEGRRRGGLSIPEIRDLAKSTWTECGICGSEDNLHVDHDHTCCVPSSLCLDCVRGVLCSRCNTALGAFRDDINALESAIGYLRRPHEEIAPK